MELFTAQEIFQLFALSSCLYFAKKCRLSSTEIPKAILKTSIVDGFKGIPAKPMIPAVINIGIRFGINEISTILQLMNKSAMIRDIARTANVNENIRLFTK